MFSLKIRNTVGAVALALASVAGASSVNASVIVEGFSGANGGDKSYDSQGFHYDPTSFDNGQCFDAVCLNDNTNAEGAFTTMTETDTSGDAAGHEGEFEVFALYFNINGNSDNWVEFSDGAGSTVRITSGIQNGDSLLNGATIYDLAGNALVGGVQFDSTGYFIDFADGYFDNINSFAMTVNTIGTTRIDCIAASHIASGDTDPDIPYWVEGKNTNFSTCLEGTTPVPVPASLPMLGSGLALVGLLAARRKRKTA